VEAAAAVEAAAVEAAAVEAAAVEAAAVEAAAVKLAAVKPAAVEPAAVELVSALDVAETLTAKRRMAIGAAIRRRPRVKPRVRMKGEGRSAVNTPVRTRAVTENPW
jgi:SWI/SNF-related matrix-associated actin-dependent regulator 1 of chromatin subfamily A